MPNLKTSPARALAIVIIIACWSVAAYLFGVVSFLLLVGAEELQCWLGPQVYNAIFPGTVAVLYCIPLVLIVWVPLLLIMLGILFGLTTVRPFRIDGGRRILVAWLSAIILAGAIHFLLLDGWPGTLAAWTLGHDTEYAPGYSTMGYLRIRTGMTKEQVRSLAGQPLATQHEPSAPNTERWHWTRSPGSNNYRYRSVEFTDGRVSKTRAGFYFD
jgi:hypothetical protein